MLVSVGISRVERVGRDVGETHEGAALQDVEGDAEIEPFSGDVSDREEGQALEALSEADSEVRAQGVWISAADVCAAAGFEAAEAELGVQERGRK